MILTGSRYMGQSVVTVGTATEGNKASVFGPPGATPVSFTYYTVVEGDRFDLIANRVYGVPDYWWRIANANPEVFYPDMLVAGSIIRIPSS